jgi:tetratricopeptide (TPR) repeat protein
MKQIQRLEVFFRDFDGGKFGDAAALLDDFYARFDIPSAETIDFILTLIPRAHWHRFYLFWSAACLSRLNRPEEALGRLHELLGDFAPFTANQNVVPQDRLFEKWEVLRALATAYFDLGNHEQCRHYLELELKLNPFAFSDAIFLAATLIDQGEYESAVRSMSQLASKLAGAEGLRDVAGEAYYQLARALDRSGDQDGARTCCAEAIRCGNKCAAVLLETLKERVKEQSD